MEYSPSLLPGSLYRISWRYLKGHPWQGVLMVIGIALGVAVMIGVDLANESARRAFDLSTTALTGETTHYLSGGSQGIEEEIYTELRREGLEFPAAPVITGYVTSTQLGGITLQALGVDPFVEAPFRSYLTVHQNQQVVDLTAFLTQPGSVLVSRDLANRYGVEMGTALEIEYAGNVYPVQIVGYLESENELTQRALDETLLMDIATAQEVIGKVGVLDRVDLILPDGNPSLITELQQSLPKGIRVLPFDAQSSTIEEMTAAFRVNLTALSLLAMVVALFLIYNTMTFSVIQRRPLFGTLRSLGMTRKEIFLMVIVEALGIGAVGAILGTTLGVIMGRGTVRLVTQTVNDLFFVTSVRSIPIPLISLVKGIGLGLVGTTLAAAFPAWEAVNISPRSVLRRSTQEIATRKVIPWVGTIGVLAIGLGGGLLAIPSKNLILSFLATFFIILGLAMLTPWVTTLLMTLITQIFRNFSVVFRMAPREVVNSISRTSIAVAALMIAVSVTIGVSLMIHSFRSTVITWLDQILQGDIYISVPGANVSQPTYPINPEVLPVLEEWQGVSRVDLLQTAVVDSPWGPIQISASNNPYDGLEQIYRSTEVPLEDIQAQMQNGAVLVSEPLVNRLDLSKEERELQLFTEQGVVRFPIAGVYYDYSSTQGNAILSLDTYRRYWEDEVVSAASLVLESDADIDSVTRSLQAALAGKQRLLIRPNQALRDETLKIFDRTFAITGTLQMMTTVVAFIGVLSAMMSLQLDKQRQIGILRAVGLTGRQLWTLVLMETGLMGLVAGFLAMPTGYILSLILIYIINRRSFGWTLLMEVTPGPFIEAILIAVMASLLAGVYPAHRIMKRSTAEAIRFE